MVLSRHKSRKHSYMLRDFKNEIVKRTEFTSKNDLSEESADEWSSDLHCEAGVVTENLEEAVVKNLALVLLTLDIFSHVPTIAIDNLIKGLHFLFTTSALPLTNSLTLAVLKEHNIEVSASLVNELCTVLYTENPLLKSIAKGGSLETTFKRKKFYYEKFNVVEPEEYVLEEKTKKTFQYIPLLKLLEQ